MNILITGASGLLGNHLTRLFLSRGHQVRVLIENERAVDGLESLPVEKFVCDIRDPDQVRGCADGMEVIIHAAADTSVWPYHSEKVREINVSGTAHLVKEALFSHALRFIYVGSACAFGWGSLQSPGTETTGYKRFRYHIDYYETKALAQQMVLRAVRDKGLPGIVVNPTFMIGPHDYKMNAARLVLSIMQSKFPGFPPGGRNFIHAADVASGIYNAVESGEIGECYILGNENLSYREFFRMVGQVTGCKVPELPIPAILVKSTGWVQSLLAVLSGNPPQLGYNMARGTCHHAFYSPEKARKRLNLSQTPISLAVYDTVEWLKKQRTN